MFIMNQARDIFIGSETGRLKRVFLHRPGRELQRITIDNKDDLLIDEIIWLRRARENHDAFADLLRDNGVEVLYFQDCLSEVVSDLGVRSALLDEALSFEAHDKNLSAALKKTVMEMPSDDGAETLI